MQLRALATKLIRRGDGTEGTLWQTTVGYPVETALEENYFLDCRSNLLPGDEIRVVRKEKDRITEYIDVMVVAGSNTPPKFYVEVEPLTPPRRFEVPVLESDKPPVVVPEEFVPEDCKAEWKGPQRRFEVTGTSGIVYATGIEDKAIAHSIARGDLPLPVKEAA